MSPTRRGFAVKLSCQTVGFRFGDVSNRTELFQLFALGYDHVTSTGYHWDGLTRIDGPLCLFQYTVSGSGCIDMGGSIRTVGPGEAFLVDIPGRHRYFLPESSPHWEFCFILFRPWGLEKHWEQACRRLSPVCSVPAESPLLLVLEDMVRSGLYNQIGDGYTASALVYRFMMELLRYASGVGTRQESWPIGVVLTVKEMESNAACIAGVEQLAEMAGLSKYHFIRLFKRHTGVTPLEFLTKVRMRQAVALLRETELTVDEVAKEVGYAGSSYFIKVFHKWVGFTPGELRQHRSVVGMERITF